MPKTAQPKQEGPIHIKEVTVKIGGRNFLIKKPRLFFDKKDPRSKSCTHQSFREEVKMSNIMRDYGKTGAFGDNIQTRKPIFGDFTGQDFATMNRQVAAIKTQFERLPAALKNKFANDPQRLIEFLADEKNNEESYKLGLREDPRRFEPYMMTDRNNNPTGIMKHPGKTSKEHRYFRDGVEVDRLGNVIKKEDTPPK